MSEFGHDDEEPPKRKAIQPVTTVDELLALDEAEMVRGYQAGLENMPSFSEYGRAYWHGYFNGQVDGGHLKVNAQQVELARAYAQHLRQRRAKAQESV